MFTIHITGDKTVFIERYDETIHEFAQQLIDDGFNPVASTAEVGLGENKHRASGLAVEGYWKDVFASLQKVAK